MYCGITNDVEARISKHNAGKGAKYTRSRRPVQLIAASLGLSKSDALKLEHAIKRRPTQKKIETLKRVSTDPVHIIKNKFLLISMDISRLGSRLRQLNRDE